MGDAREARRRRVAVGGLERRGASLAAMAAAAAPWLAAFSEEQAATTASCARALCYDARAVPKSAEIRPHASWLSSGLACAIYVCMVYCTVGWDGREVCMCGSLRVQRGRHLY